MWALGCILYQLYYLETPFKDNYEFAVFEKIKQAEVNFPKVPPVTLRISSSARKPSTSSRNYLSKNQKGGWVLAPQRS